MVSHVRSRGTGASRLRLPSRCRRGPARRGHRGLCLDRGEISLGEHGEQTPWELSYLRSMSCRHPWSMQPRGNGDDDVKCGRWLKVRSLFVWLVLPHPSPFPREPGAARLRLPLLRWRKGPEKQRTGRRGKERERERDGSCASVIVCLCAPVDCVKATSGLG